MLQLNSSCIIDPETGLNVCLYVMARQMLLFTFAYLPGWSKSPWTGHTSPLTQVLSTPTSNRSPVENQGSISKSPNAKIFTSKCQNIYGVLLFNFIKALMPSQHNAKNWWRFQTPTYIFWHFYTNKKRGVKASMKLSPG